MPDLGDLLPGFTSRTVSTEAGRLVARGAIDLRDYGGHLIAEEAPAATEANLVWFFQAAAK